MNPPSRRIDHGVVVTAKAKDNPKAGSCDVACDNVSVVGRVSSRGGSLHGVTEESSPRRSRRLHSGWPDRDGTISYLLTICVEARRHVLADDATFNRLVAFLLDSPTHYQWFGRRFVLMPDHVHLIAHMGHDAVRLSEWIKALKAVVGGLERRATRDARSGDVADNNAPAIVGRVPSHGDSPHEFIRLKRAWRWQRGFHDHKFRTPESETRKWEYVCLNPVRAGLVKRPEEWPFSGEIFYDEPAGPRLVRGTPPLLEAGILIGEGEPPREGTRPTMNAPSQTPYGGGSSETPLGKTPGEGTRLTIDALSLPYVEIYTDGGCEPNPGAGGYGVVLLHPKKRAEASGGFRLTTNNRMEIFAAITGLEMLKQPCRVTLYSDSQYLVDAMTKGWVESWERKQWWHNRTERVANRDLWERLVPLCKTHRVEFCWVRGHAGNPENERCDQLSMAALRQPNLPADEGYENKPEIDSVRPDMKEGDACPKCSTPLIKQTSSKKPKGDFYYEYYLWCPKCKATYTVEGAKRAVEQPPSLF